jgi:hypothetical protein
MIWSIFYWVLLVLAIGVGLRGLFWDRAGFRGRAKLRCRKCWYDLSASPGDVKDGAIVCSECGKEHSSRRAMCKTRRSRRWIAVGLVLWAGAYGASVTPKVQKQGWGAAVPRVLIVAALPFLSEEQGTGLDPFVLRPAASNARGFDRFILDQVPSGMSWYFIGNYIDPKASGYGWFSRRLAFVLARFESPPVLTDGTTAKGNAYKSLLSSFVRPKHSYGFESRWADRVVTIDAQILHDFGPREHPIGIVRMRRMLLGPYRVSFDEMGTSYSGSSPSSMRVNGMVPRFDTLEAERKHWVDRFLWDTLQPVNGAWGDPREAQIPGTTLPVGKDLGNGVGESALVFQFSKYIGESAQGLREDGLWTRDFSIPKRVEYRINTNRAIAIDTSLKLKGDIESVFVARLTVEYKLSKQRWVPVVILEHKNGTTRFADDIVFGGNLSLLGVNPREPAGSGTEYLRGPSESWWSWSSEVYTDIPAQRSTSGETEWRRFDQDHASLRTKARSSFSLPGELVAIQWAVKKKNKARTKVVLRITSQNRVSLLDFSGLWGDRVYEGVLQFDIPDWTVEDLRQLIVNGIAPDHAMP